MPAALMHTLPRDLSIFTGHSDELEAVLDTARSVNSGATKILAIEGMPGIGKTTLAVHAGHKLTADFPDGQLFICLHGHTPGRLALTPSDALGYLLAASGVAGPEIPTSIDARASMWRDYVSRKRLLLVIDDALDEAQVEPLLPSSPGCVVIVTSRRRISMVDTSTVLHLNVFTSDLAISLFGKLSNRRIEDHDLAVAKEIVDWCGRLPLAVSLVAGWLRVRSSWTLQDLADGLKSGQRHYMGNSENSAVRGALQLSYKYLDEDLKVFIRRISLHPGGDFDVYAAAALSAEPVSLVYQRLDLLYHHNLVQEYRRGRYRMHDLVREFIRELSSEDAGSLRDGALQALNIYYEKTALSADVWVRAEGWENLSAEDSRLTPPMASLTQALNWLETERSNLLACLDLAKESSNHLAVAAIGTALTGFLRQVGPWKQAFYVFESVVSAGDAIGDGAAVAEALNVLGLLRRMTNEPQLAINDLSRAAELFAGLGHRRGEAGALNEMGVVYGNLGDFEQAITHLARAREIFVEMGNVKGGAYVANDLAVVLTQRTDYQESIEHLNQALEAFRSIDDPYGETEVLNNLGTSLLQLSGPAVAMTRHREALDAARIIHSPLEEARALEGIGRCLARSLSSKDVAIQNLRDALEIYQRIGATEIDRTMAEISRISVTA